MSVRQTHPTHLSRIEGQLSTNKTVRFGRTAGGLAGLYLERSIPSLVILMSPSAGIDALMSSAERSGGGSLGRIGYRLNFIKDFETVADS